MTSDSSIFQADTASPAALVAALTGDPQRLPEDAFTQYPLALAEQWRAVPVRVRADEVLVALADTGDLEVLDNVTLALRGRRVEFVPAPPELLDALLYRWARWATAADESAAAADFVATDTAEADAADTGEDGRTAQLLNQVLEAALRAGASDIHVEPGPEHLTVRIRRDGVLTEHTVFPRAVASPLVNRVKVLAGLDVAERRVPQNGRFTRDTRQGRVDARVVTLPTSWGSEGLVIRLFEQSRQVLSLDGIGFSPDTVAELSRALAAPNGMILATGPTGSGKTTTLYASLGIAARADRKTVAIEDPVEVRLPAVTQLEVSERAGLTFASALRSFLRADPDVILVGEIRDTETAELAAQAALTGHLVLSTLHTNSAAGAPTRLVDLGLKPFVVASALRAVLSQRLVRRLCEHCRVPVQAGQVAERWVRPGLEVPERVWQANPAGCLRCEGSGYRGRVAVGELLPVTDDLADRIVSGATTQEIERLARLGGVPSIGQDALARVAAGLTSLAELDRVGL